MIRGSTGAPAAPPRPPRVLVHQPPVNGRHSPRRARHPLVIWIPIARSVLRPHADVINGLRLQPCDDRRQCSARDLHRRRAEDGPLGLAAVNGVAHLVVRRLVVAGGTPPHARRFTSRQPLGAQNPLEALAEYRRDGVGFETDVKVDRCLGRRVDPVLRHHADGDDAPQGIRFRNGEHHINRLIHRVGAERKVPPGGDSVDPDRQGSHPEHRIGSRRRDRHLLAALHDGVIGGRIDPRLNDRPGALAQAHHEQKRHHSPETDAANHGFKPFLPLNMTHDIHPPGSICNLKNHYNYLLFSLPPRSTGFSFPLPLADE